MTTRATPTASQQCVELRREVAALRAVIGEMMFFQTPHAPIPNRGASPELDAIRQEAAARMGGQEQRPSFASEHREQVTA